MSKARLARYDFLGVDDTVIMSAQRTLELSRSHDRTLIKEALELFHLWQGAPYFSDRDEWLKWASEHWKKVVEWRRHVLEPDVPCPSCDGAGWQQDAQRWAECPACRGNGVSL